MVVFLVAVAGLCAVVILLGALVRWRYVLAERVPDELTLTSSVDEDCIRRDVSNLCDLGPRHIDRIDALTQARELIADAMFDTGLYVHHQPVPADGHTLYNVIGEYRGSTIPDEVITVGAHYDTVVGTPGADDNASGVATLLSLACACRGMQLARTVRFVAFVNEERPFARTERMGSVHAARACRSNNAECMRGMIALDMLGLYCDKPGSQRYPFPLSLVYPNRGNFIAVVGNSRSRRLMRRVTQCMRGGAGLPVQGLALPQWLVPDIRRSDHGSFWEFGYPAVLITDTGNFRSSLYHSAKDTPDTLRYDAMAVVVQQLVYTLRHIAGT